MVENSVSAAGRGRPASYIDMELVRSLLPTLSIRQIATQIAVHHNTLNYRLRREASATTSLPPPPAYSVNPFCVVDKVRMYKTNLSSGIAHFRCRVCGQCTCFRKPRIVRDRPGRPLSEIDTAKASKLLNTRAVSDVARALGVHRNTLYRHISQGLIVGRPVRTWIARMARKKRPKGIDKHVIADLIATTDLSYYEIAANMGCSHTRVYQVAKEFSLASPERAARVHERRVPRGMTVGAIEGVTCPRCKSVRIVRHGKSKVYGTQRYKCGDCKKAFMAEYLWITSGARARHLATICRSSGYTRSDGFERWRRVRSRIWPYLDDGQSGAHDLVIAVNDAIPRAIPEHMRADICQDAIVAILECQIEQTAVTLKPFLTKWFRQNTIGFKPLSLDGPSRSRDGETLGQEMGIY